ncbi:MAG: hypothetical protein ACRDNL_27740, partial [Spirillospora sp.]
LWWAILIAHGWSLAGGRAGGATVRGQRVAAVSVTVVVLLVVGLLRFDASRIEGRVADAREGGDCARVLSDGEAAWFGHRVAGAPIDRRTDEAVQACERLRTADAKLKAGLATGDTNALKAGFDILSSVLGEPGNGPTVGSALNTFLGRLPTDNACHTVTVTDWLRQRQPTRDVLDSSMTAVTRAAPAALVRCGDNFMLLDNWERARQKYQQLLTQFPGDARTAAATKGARSATLQIELANVRSLLEDGDDGEQPEYCDSPAKYSGAKAYGKGVNPAMFYGDDDWTGKLPRSWRTTNAAKAVLIICVGEQKEGKVVDSCTYRAEDSGKLFQTDFHKVALPVKVYELRTGRVVANRKVEIGGRSCPSVIHWQSSLIGDTGPTDEYVKPSKGDVRAAFASILDR